MVSARLRSVMILSVMAVLLAVGIPARADDVLTPAEDREILHPYHDDLETLLLPDGQWWPGVKFVSSPEEEVRFVMRYDLSAYSGLQFSVVKLRFYVQGASNFNNVRLDTWYYEGNGTITPDDFDRGDVAVGTFSWEAPVPDVAQNDIQSWVEYDITDLVNARHGDWVYFNIRLSGGYPDFDGNAFGTTGAHHTVSLAAVENQAESPQLVLSPPYVVTGPDRKVFGTISLDGTGSYDPSGTIVSYRWRLVCRGNPVYDRTATGAKATVSHLRPGFYDVALTVENDSGATATGSFVVLSAVESAGDLDGDNDVDGADLAAFAGKFGSLQP